MQAIQEHEGAQPELNPEPESQAKESAPLGVTQGQGLAALLAVAAVFVLLAMGLQSFSVSGWENLAGMGGVFLFAFFAILVGVVTKTFLPSVMGSTGLTALVMAFVYPLFALVMGLIFTLVLALAILDARSQPEAIYGF